MPILVALTVAAGVLRFATLDVQSLWYDEAVTVGLIRLDFGGMLDGIPDSESTPPLYYVLAWLWTRVFGEGEVGIRSLSALLGTAAVPAFFAAARELTGSRATGLCVAALAAFNPLLIWYSQEARTYALLLVLSALSLYFFARLLEGGDRTALIGWAATSALALSAHYFAAFLLLPEAVWLLVRARPRAPVGIAVAALAATGLALLPLALHQQSLDLASFIRSNPLAYRLARAPKQFLIGFEAPLEVLLTGIVAAIVAVGGFVAVRQRLPGVVVAAGLGAAGIALPFALALVDLDYLDTRNVLLVWLPLATVVAAGLSRSRAGVAGVTVVCAIGLIAATGVVLEPLWQRDNWRGAVEAMGPASVPRAVVLTPGPSGAVPFRLYQPQAKLLPPPGAVVREVALVSKHARRLNQIHPPPPPRPRNPTIPGFREVRRVYADNFTVIVFRAPAGTFMEAAALDAFRLLPKESSSLFLQRPAPVSAGAARERRRPAG